MTEPLYLAEPYARSAPAQVRALTEEGGVVLDRSLFYPTGGGQPGDGGMLSWPGGTLEVATALRDGEQIVLIPAEPSGLPPVGTEVIQELDWQGRYRRMRMHSALHLLSVVIPLPVTGGQVGALKSRLDFAMESSPRDKLALQEALNRLVARDLPVTSRWITQEALQAQPGLVKTMSVRPPASAAHIRLVRIGTEGTQVDLQPCGGTHVASTAEIGPLRIGKIEKKSAQSRRVYLHLERG